MHSISRLITLPLLLIPLITSANAEALSPEQATELLAKSQTIDKKCNFLSSAERGVLSNLVARAEIALASQQSVADATAALTRGKATGKAATCSETERVEVSSILGAAQIASAQVPTAAPVPQSEPAPVQIIVKKPIALKRGVKKLKLNESSALVSYSSLTQRYYLQRRCGSISAKAIKALYQNVVVIHQRTLLTFGKASTAAAMRRAEAQANAQSCS